MNSELLESIIYIIYRGFGSGSVQNLNSELPESVICIMFRGSGPGCVQNSNSEHLRGSIYRKIHRVEARSRPERRWKPSGPARAAGGRRSDFIRLRIEDIEDICRNFEPGSNTPRAPMGAADCKPFGAFADPASVTPLCIQYFMYYMGNMIVRRRRRTNTRR